MPIVAHQATVVTVQTLLAAEPTATIIIIIMIGLVTCCITLVSPRLATPLNVAFAAIGALAALAVIA